MIIYCWQRVYIMQHARVGFTRVYRPSLVHDTDLHRLYSCIVLWVCFLATRNGSHHALLKSVFPLGHSYDVTEQLLQSLIKIYKFVNIVKSHWKSNTAKLVWEQMKETHNTCPCVGLQCIQAKFEAFLSSVETWFPRFWDPSMWWQVFLHASSK